MIFLVLVKVYLSCKHTVRTSCLAVVAHSAVSGVRSIMMMSFPVPSGHRNLSKLANLDIAMQTAGELTRMRRRVTSVLIYSYFHHETQIVLRIKDLGNVPILP